MAMVVQHNIQAMNANRQLGLTVGGLSKSAEKLSSGYRINRAADDAAGLTISEKMRKQMRGLDRASTNAQDGVSSVQTAEGALTEVHDMLQRMNELATQAANGTNSESDRNAIQDEVNNLLTEIDRVAETTKFNEIYLLKGDPTVDNTKTMNLKAHDAGLNGVLKTDASQKNATFTMDVVTEGQKINIGGTEYTVSEAKDGKLELPAAVTDAAISGNTVTGGALLDAAVTADKTLTYKTKDDDGAAADGWYDGSTLVSDSDLETNYGLKVTDAQSGDTIDLKKATDSTFTGTPSISGLTVSDLEATTKTGTNADAGTYTFNASTSKFEDSGTEIASGYYTGTTFRAGDQVTVANGVVATISKAAALSVEVKATATEDQKLALNKLTENGALTFSFDGTDWISGSVTLSGDALSALDIQNAVSGDEFTLGQSTVATAGNKATATYTDANPKLVGENIITKDEAYAKIKDELETANNIGAGATTKSSVAAANLITDANGKQKAVFDIKLGSIDVQKSLSFQLHVGADADMTNKIGVNIETMNTSYLGIKDLDVIGSETDNGITATYAIDAIQDAISKVSAQRSSLGAVQNRLEHTVSNLDNVVENTTAAESRIRDTDMAEEMVRYSKNNILQQAGQSMLAQANQSNQGVLSLLG